MKTQTIVLVSAMFLTGLMAGIFFTWSNAVKPGIGKLGDLEYLNALQSMNRVILNGAFLIVFIGAIIAVALVPMFHFHLYFNFEAIFELPGINLHNRILILSQFDDLKKSASSTTRPKLWRLG